MLMRGFHLLVMMVIGDRVKDTQCGFKVGRRCIWAAAGFTVTLTVSDMDSSIFQALQ